MAAPRRPTRLPRLPRHAGLLAMFVLACGGEPEEDQVRDPGAASVVLVTLDTTRFDGVGFGGAPAGITPHLDALAREGLAFDRARTVAPLTAPAHASILTGLYPPRHGVRANGVHALPPHLDTLAERARAAGYATAAFIAAVVLDDVWGLDQGFDVYDEPTKTQGHGGTFAHRPAPEVVASAVSWLEQRDRDQPFLLWVHLFDPHEPYDAEPRFYEQVGASFAAPYDRYYAEIAEMDHHLGVFLDALARLGAGDATIAVVADHGESLGAHGEGTHGPFVYDTTMQVPLLVRFADRRRAGEVAHDVVSVVDLYPTLLGCMGIDAASDIDGRDLNATSAPERGVYFESYYGYASYGWAPLAGWADGRGKYVHGPEPRFFESENDPREELGLPADGADYDRYRAAIAEVVDRAQQGGSAEVDAELLAGIRALGYAETAATGGFPSPLDPTDRPAPHTRLDEMNETIRALILQNQGRFAEAAENHRAILAGNPYNAVTLERLGFCSIQLGDFAAAADCYRRYLELHPGNAAVRQNLGTCLLRTGAPKEALAEWRRALALDPHHVATLKAAAKLARAMGRTAEAEQFERQLEKAPE